MLLEIAARFVRIPIKIKEHLHTLFDGMYFMPLICIILTRTSRNQKTYSREAAKNAKKNQGRFGFFRGFAASREKF
ncbi:MAG: hypothetical protein WC091_22850, partial [Sulfuricellaceae bacterium]